MSNRLRILENSLANKGKDVSNRIANHVESVLSANGQPLNDKRGGRKVMDKWDDQIRVINKRFEGIEITKKAIEREKTKINNVEEALETLPAPIIDLIEKGILTIWRKYPNRFFVSGVDKARIIWDEKKKTLKFSYFADIPTDEQKALFKAVIIELDKRLKERSKP